MLLEHPNPSYSGTAAPAVVAFVAHTVPVVVTETGQPLVVEVVIVVVLAPQSMVLIVQLVTALAKLMLCSSIVMGSASIKSSAPCGERNNFWVSQHTATLSFDEPETTEMETPGDAPDTSKRQQTHNVSVTEQANRARSEIFRTALF